MSDTDVVISGAGPNGLMLACELALAGITPVVLDVLPGPSDEPKANGLVGQVVRMLDMRGLYADFTGDAAAAAALPRAGCSPGCNWTTRTWKKPDVCADDSAAAAGAAA